MIGAVALGDGRSSGVVTPPPAVGATLIAAGVIVLVIGFGWLNSRASDGERPITAPMVDGVSLPIDEDGDPIEIPPSQPATAVSFGPGGEILRPDPTLARVVDESGEEVLVPLAPNTTVDTVSGRIVPTTTATTRSGSGSTATTQPGSTGTTPTTQETTTSTDPPPSTSTTASTTTTTEPPTTTDPPTTEPPPTTDDTLGGLLALLLP